MSLKAKLEAVIYAAEEPVTLSQLASLFAEEALRWRAGESARNDSSEAQAQIRPDIQSATEPEYAAALSGGDSTAELAELLAVVEEMNEEGVIAASEASIILLDEITALPSPTIDAELISSDPEMSNASGSQGAVAPDFELEAKRLEQKRSREVREILRDILDELIAEYASDSRGIEIREIAGGFRMGTKPEIHDAVRSFVKSLKPAMKLSMPALETLAVIAYKQPVTAPEVGEIRGVDSAGVLGSLMSRKLITTAGRKQVIGRPMLYKTTKEFLLRFGLKDVNELPSMEEFEKIAALELSETDDADSAGESYAEAAAASGDLFADSVESEPTEENDSEQFMSASKQEAVTATSIPTAESSQEAAAAHALVERQNAEEVEAER